ncbi:MAG TPA: hypothetical protein VJN70_04640 [Gemmatimonadaceae bacterium]|nr:hypothetical protein [Gemmatimonadaceae bacterium]
MRRTRLALLRGVSTLLASALASAVKAQDSVRAQPSGDATRRPVSCTGQRVNDIVIHAFAPTIAALRSVPVVAEIARSVHATTRPDLIRRYLLMGRGDTCTELRRLESERILRAQPFLADASVLAYPADSGAVDLEVRTIDETSAIIAGTVSSASPFLTSARVGSSNLGGGGLLLAGNWRHDPNFRDGFGIRFTDYQLGALPYILNFEAQQDPLGNHIVISSTHPFLTDLQQLAWNALAGSTDDYVLFSTSQDIQHAFNSQRNFFNIGGLVRVGPPGRLNLFGASIAGEQEVPGLRPILVTPAGPLVDTTSAFANRYSQHRIARANVLWGVRDIGFVRVTGFDALTATQDIPVGFQLGTQFGRSLTMLGARDDDVFMSGDLYVGAARDKTALRLQMQGEARHSNDLNAWDGMVTSGRATQYVKVSDWQTAIASLEWSSGWRLRIPFALTLGAQRGGVRGYADEATPGGQRAIVRVEDRYVVGRPFGLGDAGVGFFADAGRLWAGDVPFGQSTPLRASVGFSVLASVPPRSARLWRLDIAVPINPAGPRRLELRITSNDQTTFFWREPDDVQIAREKTVPSSIFNWP